MHVDMLYTTAWDGDLRAEGGPRSWLMCAKGALAHGLVPEGSLRVADKPFAGSLRVHLASLEVSEGLSEGGLPESIDVEGVVVGEEGFQPLRSHVAFYRFGLLVVRALGLIPGKHVDLDVHVGQTPKEEDHV